MKFTQSITTLLLALAGSAAARAAAVADPQPGDLFVGFRASGGQGGSTSYLVKLGNDTAFTNNSATLDLGNIGGDLASIFGDNWHDRSDLFWGIVGHRTSASSIIYGSKERTDPTQNSTAWPALDASSRNSTDSFLTAVTEGVGGYRGRDATTRSAFATTQPNSSQSSSYNFEVATEGTTDFGSLSQWGSIEGSFANGTNDTVLDLYRIAGSGVTQRGSFAINDAGVISYFAVPEPASAALLGLGALLLARRRRPQHASANS